MAKNPYVSHSRTTSEPLMTGQKVVDHQSKEIIYNLRLELIRQKSKYMDLVDRTKQVFACLQKQLIKDKEEIENALATKDYQIDLLQGKLRQMYRKHFNLQIKLRSDRKKRNFHMKPFKNLMKKPPRLRKMPIIPYKDLHSRRGSKTRHRYRKVARQKSKSEGRVSVKRRGDSRRCSNREYMPTQQLLKSLDQSESSVSEFESEKEEAILRNILNIDRMDTSEHQTQDGNLDSSSTSWEVLTSESSEIVCSRKKYFLGNELDSHMTTIETIIKSESGVKTSFKESQENETVDAMSEKKINVRQRHLPLVTISHPSESEGDSRKSSCNSHFETSNIHKPGKFLQVIEKKLNETDESESSTDTETEETNSKTSSKEEDEGEEKDKEEEQEEKSDDGKENAKNSCEVDNEKSETSDSETDQRHNTTRLRRFDAFRGERKSFSTVVRRF